METPETLAPDILDRMKIFEGVSPEVLEGILHASTLLKVEQGKVVIAPGEENRFLFVVLEGQLRIHLESLDGDAVTTVGPGETVGEMSVIEQKPSSAFVVAETCCRLLVISEEILWSLIQVSHAAACNFLILLSGRLRRTNNAIVERMQVERVYRQYGNVDALTGLRNRHWLDKTLSRQLHRSLRSSQPLTLVMSDIDNFKLYNDTHGHLAGDRAIHAMAHALLENLRPSEMAARYGGDEFVVILPETDLVGARTVAERLRLKVMESPLGLDQFPETPKLTISLGIVQAQPGDTVNQLLAAADAALYRAKDKGRNVVSD